MIRIQLRDYPYFTKYFNIKEDIWVMKVDRGFYAEN